MMWRKQNISQYQTNYNRVSFMTDYLVFHIYDTYYLIIKSRIYYKTNNVIVNEEYSFIL